jgi:hypothetical protein
MLLEPGISSLDLFTTTAPFQSRKQHFTSQESDLCLQWQILGTEVVATQQRHTAKDAVIISDEIVEICIVTLIARIEPEAGNLVQSNRAGKFFIHLCCATGGYTATALDATVKLIYLLRQIRIHALFEFIYVYIIVTVQPGFQSLTHPPHPLSRVNRQVGDQLEDWQWCKRDLLAKILC